MSISEYNFSVYWEATEHTAQQKAESAPKYLEERNNSAEKHVRLVCETQVCNTAEALTLELQLHCAATVPVDSNRSRVATSHTILLLIVELILFVLPCESWFYKSYTKSCSAA